jgi:hypothetical protein
MADPLGGDVRSPEAPTTFLEDIDGGPLGGDDGDPRVPTTFLEDVNGGPPSSRCRKPESAHHLS